MIEQIRREIQRALAGTRTAMRAVLKGGMTLGTRVQRLNAEALAGEILQDVELMQQFGFTSGLPDGTQLIVIPLGGRTSASVVVASEHGGYRFKVNNKGEAAVYNQWGDVIHLKKDRSIDIVAGLKVRLETPLTEMTGELVVTGNISSGGDITAAGDVSDQGGTKTMAGMRTTFNEHTQPVSGGVAQQPGSTM